MDWKYYFSEPFSKTTAWLDMIMLASHKDKTIVIRGVEINLKRGQLAYSELSLAKRWRWSRNKLLRFLKTLKTEQQIEHQSNNVTTVITVLNYDTFNPNDTTGELPNGLPERHQKVDQKDTKRTTKRDTNKNDKNEKNEKKEYPEIECYILEFNSLFGTAYKVTDGRTAKLKARLNSYSLDQIMQATLNLSKSPFHRGQNDRKWMADPDFLIRSDEQIDKWLNQGQVKEVKPVYDYKTDPLYKLALEKGMSMN